ncbi:MAG TPA: DUF3617 family protein [Thermoanaerobaculia bacterium]|nr:DUF3617 family protein [Thermoanaerobaculia bacterium]
MSKIAKSLFVCAAAWFAFAVPSFAAEGHMREGQWEITTRVEMPGLPVSIPPITITKCLTKEDVNDPDKTVPKGGGKNDACKVSDYKVVGNKISWTLKCDEKSGGMTGSGEMTVKGDSYDGSMKMTMQGQDMSMTFSGKRTGDCK